MTRPGNCVRAGTRVSCGLGGTHMTRRATRRDFIGLTGAAIGAAAGIRWSGAPSVAAQANDARDADLVVVNAKVYTMEAAAQRAEAFAVKASRIIAVGTSAEIRGLAGRRTETIDAQQMTVVPGFIDCHNHAPGATLLYEVLVGNPFEVEFVTISSIVEKLRARAKETPPGTWVDGYFFDDTKVKDKRELDASDLDEVSMDHPVVVRHRGGHTSYYNHKALEMAGITKNTANPAGGTYDR